MASLALLSGCDGGAADPSPSTSNTTATTPPSPTSSSTPSTETTTLSATTTGYVPVKPDFPAAAKKQTLKSAEAFVKYYYELVNYAYAKPEAGLLGPLGTDDCKSCKSYESLAADLVEKDQHYDGPMVTFERVSFSTEDLKNPWIIFNGDQPGSRIVDANEKTVYESKKIALHIRVVLIWTTDGWRIQELANT
ncbi:MAG TPA: DUF6318 family protein [Tetrasphaera sp.]|uniref:DUF6318 family protein n=1 Tax=Nostocoides sp. TaxID=1917966 RepID=UPI002BA635FE|nr:DUF6318 family protein [Tetrasphaera sp.]HNQ06367.1 DUF6318 family protein [Tetrasphaera sp.]